MTQAAPAIQQMRTGIEQGMQQRVEMTCVYKAVVACRPPNNRGKAANMWQLSTGVLFDVAELHCVRFKSADKIRNELMTDQLTIKGKLIARNSLSRWLARINKKYQELYEAELASMDADAFAARGDVGQVLFSHLVAGMTEVRKLMAAVPLIEMTVPERHFVMRSMEICERGAKTFYDMRLKEAQIAQIDTKLAAIGAEVGSGKLTGPEAEAAIMEVMSSFQIREAGAPLPMVGGAA